MLTFPKLTLLSAVLFSSAPLAAFAAPADFLGTWKNTDPKTKGVVTAIIDDQEEGGMQVFASCHPDPCDWGRVKFTISGESAKRAKEETGVAHFHSSHAEKKVVAKILKGQKLQLETSTKFTDNSGRKDYTKVETFKKTE